VDLLRLQPGPLSVDEAIAHVADAAAGGTCVFVGTVRDHSDGIGAVTHLEYEAYEEAAGAAMARVAGEVRSAVPGVVRLAILHRHGDLAVGEASVVVAASAAHRGEAFAAARLAIDGVKQTVPIWKKEHRADGTAEWVACHQAAGARAR
jgi:molybdopterin synthase catalytic subunit